MESALISFAFGIIGGAVAAWLVKFQSTAKTYGTESAAAIGSFIDKTVPATLRPAVISELKALTTSGPLSTASVTGVASAILAKIGTQFPTVVKDDIVLIVSDYVQAFGSGLANLT